MDSNYYETAEDLPEFSLCTQRQDTQSAPVDGLNPRSGRICLSFHSPRLGTNTSLADSRDQSGTQSVQVPPRIGRVKSVGPLTTGADVKVVRAAKRVCRRAIAGN